MEQSLEVGLIQFAAGSDPRDNLTKALSWIEAAAVEGAQMICLQELFTTIYFPLCPPDDRYFDWAEALDGESMSKLRDVCVRLGIWLLAPIYEQGLAHRPFNTVVLIGPDGSLCSKWRKHHIPRVRIPNGEIDEKYYFEPATGGYHIAETPYGRVGVLVCHDRHFPEAARCLALAGADLVFVPSASRGLPRSTDPGDIWLTELRTLALQNMYYVFGVNRVGTEMGESFLGMSAAIGPDGDVIALAGKDEGMLLAKCQVSRVRQTRLARGFLRDRRPESYRALVDG